MPATASLTVDGLVGALKDEGLVTDERLVTLLGAVRDEVTVDLLEQALSRDNVLSDARLAALKEQVSGLPVCTDTQVVALPNVLDADLAERTGALALSVPGRKVVGMVCDEPDLLNLVRASIGDDFELHLLTFARFEALYRHAYQQVELDTRPVADGLAQVLTESVRRDASDVHLHVGLPPKLRINGTLVEMNLRPLDAEWMERETRRLLTEQEWLRLQDETTLDRNYRFGDTGYRVNVGKDTRGLTITMRQLPREIPTMDAINLPPAVRQFVNLEKGLVLVTGATGSGKSTTLASLLAEIAARHSKKIITLEDPVEYTLPQGRSVVSQRELRNSFRSFPEALRQALRQDPDVILVGELRDLETTRTALLAAETGHLVFATVHTNSAPGTVNRIVAFYPADEQDAVRTQLAHNLSGVVSQVLLPLKTGRGRVAAFEVMLNTEAVRVNLEKADKMRQVRQHMESGVREGMCTMEMSLAELVRQDRISRAVADAHASAKDDLARRLSGR